MGYSKDPTLHGVALVKLQLQRKKMKVHLVGQMNMVCTELLYLTLNLIDIPVAQFLEHGFQ